jgi:hypothetical protein
MSPSTFTEIKDDLSLSYVALATLLGKAQSTVQAYARRGPTDEVARKLRDWQEHGLPPSKFSEISGLDRPEALTEKTATSLVGTPISLLEVESKVGVRYGLDKTAVPYSFRLTGGTQYRDISFGATWEAREMSIQTGGPGRPRKVEIGGGMTLGRAMAHAWAGDPPHDAWEAHRPDPDAPLTADNVGWRPREERVQEDLHGRSTEEQRQTGRDSKVRLSNALALALRKEYHDQVRAYGLTWVVEKILRDDIGMDRPLTPKERQTGIQPDTIAAHIRLTAHRNPHLNKNEIAKRVGEERDENTSAEYVGKVLAESQVSLKELRRRQDIDETMGKHRQRNFEKNICEMAKTGKYTGPEIADQVGLTADRVYHILSKHDISLSNERARYESS